MDTEVEFNIIKVLDVYFNEYNLIEDITFRQGM